MPHMQVAEAKRLGDPPLLRLERESSHAYLSMLLHARSNLPELSAEANIEGRLMQLCLQNLERFQVRSSASSLVTTTNWKQTAMRISMHQSGTHSSGFWQPDTALPDV